MWPFCTWIYFPLFLQLFLQCYIFFVYFELVKYYFASKIKQNNQTKMLEWRKQVCPTRKYTIIPIYTNDDNYPGYKSSYNVSEAEAHSL